jgi:hypothetical protein
MVSVNFGPDLPFDTSIWHGSFQWNRARTAILPHRMAPNDFSAWIT